MLPLGIIALVLAACHPWPSADNTGPPADTTFTEVNGDFNANTSGQVVEALHIQGGFFVCNAANVTFRNSRITGGYGILANHSCTGLRVNNVEVDCGNRVGSAGFMQDWGFVGQDIELRNMNMHRCENGVFIDNGVKVFNSWIHEPITPGDSVTGAHSDGIQLWAGASDVVLDGNNIDYRGDTTSAIITGGAEPDPDFGWTSELTINHNKLAGGAYTLYLPNQRKPKGSSFDNVSVTNNRFAQNAFAYGYCTGYVNELVWSSNVVDETDQPITSC